MTAMDRDTLREALVDHRDTLFDIAERAAQRVRDYDAFVDAVDAPLPPLAAEVRVDELPMESLVRHAGEEWRLVERRGDRWKLVTDGGAVDWVDGDQVVNYQGDPFS